MGAVAIATVSLFPGVEAPEPLSAEIEIIEVTQLSVDELIAFNAEHYGVSEDVMRTVINCESGYNAGAIGDGGQSLGLVQIHQPSHPSITREQSFDPVFATDFLAKNLAEGNGHMWTCYRKYYG